MPSSDVLTRAEVYTSLQEHFARYFDVCDRGDLDAIVDLLQGATLVAGSLETDDPNQIRAAYAARHPAPGPDERRRVKNHGMNMLLDGPSPDGSWRVTLYYLRIEARDTAGQITTSGRLEQQVIRQGQGWRVRRHVVTTDF